MADLLCGNFRKSTFARKNYKHKGVLQEPSDSG